LITQSILINIVKLSRIREVGVVARSGRCSSATGWRLRGDAARLLEGVLDEGPLTGLEREGA
jgi:hypothetical protein